jgi:hypothetical protein
MASSGYALRALRLHLHGRAAAQNLIRASLKNIDNVLGSLEDRDQTRSGLAVSCATENPAQASDAGARSANTSKSCKSPRFERQCVAYKCVTADLQYDNRVSGPLNAKV